MSGVAAEEEEGEEEDEEDEEDVVGRFGVWAVDIM